MIVVVKYENGMDEKGEPTYNEVLVKPFKLKTGALILKKISEFSKKAKENEDFKFALNAIVASLTTGDTSDIGFATLLISISTVCGELYDEIMDLISSILEIDKDTLEDMQFETLQEIVDAVKKVNNPTVISPGYYEALYTIPMNYANKQLLIEAKGMWNGYQYLQTNTINCLRVIE